MRVSAPLSRAACCQCRAVTVIAVIRLLYKSGWRDRAGRRALLLALASLLLLFSQDALATYNKGLPAHWGFRSILRAMRSNPHAQSGTEAEAQQRQPAPAAQASPDDLQPQLHRPEPAGGATYRFHVTGIKYVLLAAPALLQAGYSA